MSFAVANLIVEEGVPDVLCDSGHSLDFVRTVLVALDFDAVAEGGSIIPNRPEGTRKVNWRNAGLELVLTTYPNNFVRCSCSLSSHTPSSLSSPEHSRSSLAKTESSLVFTPGDFCSAVRGYRDKLSKPHHLVKF